MHTIDLKLIKCVIEEGTAGAGHDPTALHILGQPVAHLTRLVGRIEVANASGTHNRAFIHDQKPILIPPTLPSIQGR